MTDEIDAKSSEGEPQTTDSTSVPASEDETKVIPTTAEPAKAETAQESTPGVVRLKKASEASKGTKKKGGSGFVSSVALVLWSAVRFLGRVTWDIGKVTLWRIPNHAWRAYRGIPSSKVRRGVALGIGLLIGVGVFFLWPDPSNEVSADPNREFCEFLARPAAKVYVDGRLASEEVPPIHRTPLRVGEHTVRFVSPENRSHEAKIEVVKGKPTQWFMNFIENRMDQRPLISGRGEK